MIGDQNIDENDCENGEGGGMVEIIVVKMLARLVMSMVLRMMERMVQYTKKQGILSLAKLSL